MQSQKLVNIMTMIQIWQILNNTIGATRAQQQDFDSKWKQIVVNLSNRSTLEYDITSLRERMNVSYM